MPAKVLFIGVDAAECTRIERWAAEGRLPNFARLAAEGSSLALSTCLETLPGSVWPEIASGRSAGALGLFYHPWQLHTGEAEPRPVAPEDVDGGQYFWNVASRAGRRVAVVDLPQCVPVRPIEGLQVFEWGLHDRWLRPASEPPGLYRELHARYGDYPVQHCDLHHDGTLDGYRKLLDDLLEGARRKSEMLLDLIGRERWDLFACAFGESHCAGHHFWHFGDPDDRGYDPSAPAELRDGLARVYAEIDRGIGALRDAAGPDARVAVLASHGMGPRIGGPQLLPEFLERMELCPPKPVEDPRVRLRSRLPKGLRHGLKRLVGARAFRASEKVLGVRQREMDRPGIRATVVKNNRCGGIRLNLVGREPQGSVQPGAEADALIEEIRRELLALEDPKRGGRVVAEVKSARECFGPDHHPDVPDLIVVFRSEGELEAAGSERLGDWEAPLRELDGPYWRQSSRRTGDHTPRSKLWTAGPDSALQASGGCSIDLAPTLLRWLDVELPDFLDGSPLV